MAYKDDDVEEFRAQEQTERALSKAKQDAARKKRLKKLCAAEVLRAMTARDARAFETQLRRLEIDENSEEWKRAWKLFSEQL